MCLDPKDPCSQGSNNQVKQYALLKTNFMCNKELKKETLSNNFYLRMGKQWAEQTDRPSVEWNP